MLILPSLQQNLNHTSARRLLAKSENESVRMLYVCSSSNIIATSVELRLSILYVHVRRAKIVLV